MANLSRDRRRPHGLTVFVLGSTGTLARGGAFLAAMVAFGITAWIAFGGGAERFWAELLDRGVIEW